jgi:hypothetical protein
MSVQDPDDSRNYTETIGTRLTPQTKRQFDEYREANELGKTEAARRLIRDGLDETDETLRTVNKTALLAGFVYVFLYLTNDPATAGTVGGVYIAFAVVWSTYPATVGRYLP